MNSHPRLSNSAVLMHWQLRDKSLSSEVLLPRRVWVVSHLEQNNIPGIAVGCVFLFPYVFVQEVTHCLPQLSWQIVLSSQRNPNTQNYYKLFSILSLPMCLTYLECISKHMSQYPSCILLKPLYITVALVIWSIKKQKTVSMGYFVIHHGNFVSNCSNCLNSYIYKL